MFYEDFQKISLKESKKIINAVNTLLKDQPYDKEKTICLGLDLPFYHGHQIVRVSDQSVHPVREHFIIYNEIDSAVYMIDFTNDCIKELNRSIPIMLDTYNVLEYIRFFFASISGTHGRFLVVETFEDIAWRENPPPNAREVISKMINPLEILEEDKNGSFEILAYMVFKTGLFRTKLTVKADGEVIMHHEEMLIEDMPIIDDLIGF